MHDIRDVILETIQLFILIGKSYGEKGFIDPEQKEQLRNCFKAWDKLLI